MPFQLRDGTVWLQIPAGRVPDVITGHPYDFSGRPA